MGARRFDTRVSASVHRAGFSDAPISALGAQVLVVEALVSAPDARAYFLLLRQKKVAKEKATPGAAPA
ncbi:MAG: hypothetical protein H6R14_1995, partial [Proteobacteria bacterium]|nr:hypothetical protein [Pseudomonadota bacterium]